MAKHIPTGILTPRSEGGYIYGSLCGYQMDGDELLRECEPSCEVCVGEQTRIIQESLRAKAERDELCKRAVVFIGTPLMRQFGTEKTQLLTDLRKSHLTVFELVTWLLDEGRKKEKRT